MGDKFKYIRKAKYLINKKLLTSYKLNCHSKHCLKLDKCCCKEYDIEVTEYEIEKIETYFDQISFFCPEIRSSCNFENVFEKVGKHFLIDKKDDDYCIFSYLNESCEIKCGIHSAALKIGIDPNTIKPFNCVIWPICLNKIGSNTVIDIVYDKSWPCLSVNLTNNEINLEFEKIINWIVENNH